MVLNFILRMKIKVVLYCGILGILLMIFTAFIELFNALFHPKPDGEWKIASDIIEGDLKMVSFLQLKRIPNAVLFVFYF